MFFFSFLFFGACHIFDGNQNGRQSAEVLQQVKPITPDNFILTSLGGETLKPDVLQNKVVLYVNVASKCGFTGQYEQLQKVHTQYKDRGFSVVGVPCNQFGGQEAGSAEEIVTFCRKNYGVDFPLLEKQDVNGKNRSPLYGALVNSPAGEQKNIRWNFEKFLVDANGQVIERFSSMTKPDASSLTQAIEQALQKQ